MTKHYNPSIVNDALRIFNSKQGDYLPDDIAGPVAVINIERIIDVVKSNQSATSGGITIYTTPSDRDFYLTNACLSFVKNATCDAASGRIALTVVINGVTIDALQLAMLTLTAERDTVASSWDKGIKLDRGSNVAIGGVTTFTAGAMVKAATIQGYTVDVLK